jgi:GT2 family glycosyltransferase
VTEATDERIDGQTTMASTSCLMLTYNQEALTVEALRSYESAAWPAPLLLLDNGTGTDGAAARDQFAHRLGHDLRIFGDGTNYGVSGGRNYLAERATSDWLVFVDNDVLFTEELAGFVEELGRSSSDIVLPISLDGDGRVGAAGGTYQAWLSWSRSGYPGAEVEVARRDLERCADWGGGGGCFSVRRSTFEAMGGFDAGQHGLYGAEDIDFCLRARKAGARSRRSASAPVIHLDLGAGADPARKYQTLRKSSAALRSTHGVWITRYPAAWFWYFRRSPRLQSSRRSLGQSAARLRQAASRRRARRRP